MRTASGGRSRAIESSERACPAAGRLISMVTNIREHEDLSEHVGKVDDQPALPGCGAPAHLGNGFTPGSTHHTAGGAHTERGVHTKFATPRVRYEKA